MTLCVPLLGGDPSPKTKKATHFPPFVLASDALMVTLPPVTLMFPAWMAPARVWQRRSTAAYTHARTRSSCLSPKPETLNPETESGTSGAGPGPATRECQTEQTCELCGQTPAQIKSDSCVNGDLANI